MVEFLIGVAVGAALSVWLAVTLRHIDDDQ